jgi:hypothetical protein
MRPRLAVPAAILLALASACRVRTITPESDATFAMHQESREFVVDRPLEGAPAVVNAAEWLRVPGDPAWALRHDDHTLAAYWIDATASLTARSGPGGTDAPIGVVRPSWDQNAIRLRIEPRDGEPLASDVFARTIGFGGPDAIRRNAETVLDMRGRYRAVLRDPSGAEVGWIRVRVGPYEQAARVYEAALPAAIDERLAVAAVLALASELDWIEARAFNVYQGDRGPLIQSYPIPLIH